MRTGFQNNTRTTRARDGADNTQIQTNFLTNYYSSKTELGCHGAVVRMLSILESVLSSFIKHREPPIYGQGIKQNTQTDRHTHTQETVIATQHTYLIHTHTQVDNPSSPRTSQKEKEDLTEKQINVRIN